MAFQTQRSHFTTSSSSRPSARILPATDSQRRCAVLVAAKRQQDNMLTSGLVSVLTESLRLAGVGKGAYEAMQSNAAPVKRLRRGDVKGVMQRITSDFKKNSYIVTGIIDDAIYDEDCYFVDPTVGFSGLQLWKRNLQLLVPFLIEPRVDLLAIKRLPKEAGDDAQRLLSEWRLETTLSLPWRPFISVLGATEYTLNEDSNQVVRHEESWNVSGTEAVLQILRPGPKQDEARSATKSRR